MSCCVAYTRRAGKEYISEKGKNKSEKQKEKKLNWMRENIKKMFISVVPEQNRADFFIFCYEKQIKFFYDSQNCRNIAKLSLNCPLIT